MVCDLKIRAKYGIISFWLGNFRERVQYEMCSALYEVDGWALVGVYVHFAIKVMGDCFLNRFPIFYLLDIS